MAEAKIRLTAEDRASSVINHVQQRMGLLNKQGISMGITFAAINIGMQAVSTAIQKVGQFVSESIEKFRSFERAMAEVNTMLTVQQEHLLHRKPLSLFIIINHRLILMAMK